MMLAAVTQEGIAVKKLRIAEDLALPLDAVTQTLAAIGRKGAGKTYLATMLAEQMLDAGAQVVALDPVGNWWGLRVGADGKSKGKELFVIGGDHGDVPLAPEVGARIARLIVEKNVSAVLDISGFRLGERKRFAADFGEELLHLKKRQRSPVHLFIEEAQLLIPQRVGPEEARMVGAYEQLVRLGRNYGIGCTLVTQRPQSVNKEVLSQVECLCVLQVTGPHERKALEEWVQEVGGERKLVGELPGLHRGEGYVWSPSWLRTYQRVRFSKKTTFDASATPEVGKAARAASLSAVDVEALKTDLAEVVKKAEADDPKALRRRIAELEREVAKKPAAAPAAPATKVDPKLAAQVRQLRKAVEHAMKFLVTINAESFFKAAGEGVDRDGIEKALAAAAANVTRLLEAKVEHRNREIERLQKEAGRVLSALKTLAADDVAVEVTVKHNEPFTVAPAPLGRRPIAAPPPRAPARPRVEGEVQLRAGARRMLEVLARSHPERRSRSQVGTLAGMTPSGGTFGTYLSDLKRAGVVEEDGAGLLGVTAAGFEVLGDAPREPQSTEEVLETWRRALRAGERAMLDALVEAYPRTLTRAELGEATGITPSGGTFGTYLSVLRRNGLADVQGDELRAGEALFLSR